MLANSLSAPATAASQLRDYQMDVVTAVRAVLRDKRNPLMVIPTGGGKTVVFLWFAQFVATYLREG